MLLPLLLLACQAQDGDLSGDLDALTVEPSEHVPNVLTLRWSGPPGEVFVEYGLDGALDLLTPARWSEDGEAEIPLLGLKAGRGYSAVAVTVDEDGARHESELLSLDVPLPPADAPAMIARTFVEDLEPGAILTSIAQPETAYLLMLDRDGDIVWWFAMDADFVVSSQSLSLDRQRVLALVGDKSQDTDVGSVYSIALDGSSVEIIRTPAAHHDFMELEDGGLAWLAIAQQETEVDGHVVNVIGDALLTLDAEGQTAERFNVFQDYVAPWRACPHFDGGMYGLIGHDWTHANSLIAGDGGTAYVGLRNLDALLHLDLETGALLGQLGGRDSDYTLLGQSVPWTHAHISHAWDDGLMVFDNGPFEPNSVSRVVEYAVDHEARTYQQVWSHDIPTGGHVEVFGDARRLADDNVLVSWSTEGLIEEVGRDHEPRWDLQLYLGAFFGRVEWVGDLYAPTPN